MVLLHEQIIFCNFAPQFKFNITNFNFFYYYGNNTNRCI